jgi:3-phenylpropionate/trans-cinnamate dioxygenase ferredoxin reductase subunit
VLTDQEGRTSVPDVWAAGDVARAFDHRHGEHRRSEHWDAAARQGMAVARSITGDRPDPYPLPSFWSDQYGLRIQYFGHAESADDATVEGKPGDRDFCVVYTRDGRPVGAFVVDGPRAFARLRKEIERTYAQSTNGKEQR